MMVEVDASQEDPKFIIKRISQGNEELERKNELRDSIVIYKNERKPGVPTAISPSDETVDFTGATLKAGDFNSSYSNAFHAASHWQVAVSTDFEKPIFDSWKQYENWYYKENRQKDDDLTDEKTNRLKPNTTYYWRVRYRDQNLNWSDWSNTASFTTNNE